MSAFLRSAGSDQVRAIQIVLLIAIGMCLGASLVMLIQFLRTKAG
jgi:hypothetical protein